MTAAELIRTEIRRQKGEFTSDDIWREVKRAISHLKWPNGAIISELCKAQQCGEIVRVRVKRAGKTIVNVWRLRDAPPLNIADDGPAEGCADDPQWAAAWKEAAAVNALAKCECGHFAATHSNHGCNGRAGRRCDCLGFTEERKRNDRCGTDTHGNPPSKG